MCVERRFVENNDADDFDTSIASLEAQISKQQPSVERLQRLVSIWRTCVNMETAFWQMGLDQS